MKSLANAILIALIAIGLFVEDTGTTYAGVTANGVMVQGVMPEGATLEGVTLEGVTLEGVTLEGVTLEGVTQKGAVSANYAGVVLQGVLVWKLLQQFEGVGKSMLSDGLLIGNSMITKAGDQLRLATANVAIALAKEREKTFDQLSQVQKEAIIELNKILLSVNTSTDKITSSIELASLDMQELVNRIPFSSKAEFYISSVNGITLKYNGPKRVVIRGIGFGYDENNKKYQVKVKVAGVEIPPINLVRTDSHTLEITIPDEVLESYYKDNSLGSAPIVLTSKVIKKRWYGNSSKDYSVDFHLLLLPKKPGKMRITEVVRTEAKFSGDISTKSMSGQSDHASPDDPYDWHDKVCVPDDKRVVGVTYECTSGQCGWCYNQRNKEPNRIRAECATKFPDSIYSKPIGYHGIKVNFEYANCVQTGIKPGMQYFPDFDIEEDYKCVTAYRHCDGEQKTNFIYYVLYRDFKPGFETKTSQQIDLEYGKDIVVQLDANNPDCSFVVNGAIPTTKQTFDLDHQTAASSNILRLKGIAKVGACRATFELLP